MRLLQNIDVEAARHGFEARQRLRVMGVLADTDADSLHACLLNQVAWNVVFNNQSQAVVMDPAHAVLQDAATAQALNSQIIASAARGFQYLYRSYPMVTAYLEGRDPELLLHRVFEALNSPEVLESVRRISDIRSLRKCDAQATCYRPGDFLMQHDDSGSPGEARRVAYVLNLSKGWRADWGGLLQFHDQGGDVIETWLPTYNSLALFKVPMLHSVSYVAPFAGRPRFAITGWFRDN